MFEQGYRRLGERFPGIWACDERQFLRAVTEMKVCREWTRLSWEIEREREREEWRETEGRREGGRGAEGEKSKGRGGRNFEVSGRESERG